MATTKARLPVHSLTAISTASAAAHAKGKVAKLRVAAYTAVKRQETERHRRERVRQYTRRWRNTLFHQHDVRNRQRIIR